MAYQKFEGVRIFPQEIAYGLVFSFHSHDILSIKPSECVWINVGHSRFGLVFREVI